VYTRHATSHHYHHPTIPFWVFSLSSRSRSSSNIYRCYTHNLVDIQCDSHCFLSLSLSRGSLYIYRQSLLVVYIYYPFSLGVTVSLCCQPNIDARSITAKFQRRRRHLIKKLSAPASRSLPIIYIFPAVVNFCQLTRCCCIIIIIINVIIDR
jgi:hypothetical protein